MTDTRIVYGASCAWWDGIDKVGHTPGSVSIPCCPHCGGVLFELPDEKSWFDGVDKYEASGHPGYSAFIKWLRGKCFASYQAAQRAYASEAGNG